MITLKEKDLIAVSGPRACYLHPQEPDKVIKVVRKIPRLRRHNANYQEWRHYHYLMKRHGKLNFINQCHGFTKTNIGEGLIWSCVRDAGGEISRTVTGVMKNPERYDLDAIEHELIRFCNFIVERNIQLFDLNPLNVLIRVREDGTYEAVSADIKGRYANHEFIPISTYIPFFSRIKLGRRTNELLTRFQGFLAEER